jgi:Raf kinase inhibitor-like YbhB/YbcL family protein
MRIDPVVSFAVLSLSIGACGKSDKSSGAETTAVITNIGRPQANTAGANTTPMTFNLASSAFTPNGSVPTKYTCEGAGISPPLVWSRAPAGTKSFALIVEDPDAPDPAKPTRVVSHWVAYNIPAGTTSLAENASKTGMPAGSAQGSNERGTQGYMGPCPPIGHHRYFFKLFALDTVLQGLTNPKKADLEKAIQGHVVGTGELVGIYQKTK